ncbi:MULTISPECIES: ABC transporter ATP-binding protein [Halomonadaceae]|jgi:peptide/nickel transport system ATP-binding protein|uniref:ABC transporter ATP-binding protein n=1 Tax=Halomonadaceae TaxID=28256 RepID=UPI0012F44EC4|nr:MULTISPECIES: ABC transporter ATP-binding protein [Halomonas]CAD5250224.1 putative peptide transport fused subunits of ABC superfamily: ATP-binding components [Halomonas sp. I3]CAD5273245.1 putative peptide transport fused subunits of ABC superfamily: ATP-binding components [Halomonas sp. 113]CAD5275049.1 putative peptide transport fused subunits of ABC superfamily: ATP-binding components [Halomonas sp. 59]CAD5278533.1 putative peptide transport fused subunits of ABC superfamily: ATP-binding
MMADTPILEVENLVVETAGRKPTRILDAISFTIGAGETLCLVGESGSGKSVTSLATMGLLPPGALVARSGQIRLAGENVLAATPAQLRALRGRHMAMIFQEPMTALNPVLSVGRQLDEVLCQHTSQTAQQRRARVLEVFEQVHLPDVERIYTSYPHQLSGGQRQRIMIAMALLLKPQLLIADEPTTALDVTTQHQILALIKELQREHGTAVLFITHDMGVVVDIADRVCVMHRGQLVESGPVRQVLGNPQEAYTQRLLAAVPSLVPRVPREATSNKTVLEVQSLEKVFNTSQGVVRWLRKPVVPTRAVDDVSFVLKRGRTLGIVGESGSGKSTLARCVMRLITPTGGNIRVSGKQITELPKSMLKPHRKRIQMIFQDPNRSLNPRMTVGQSLTEGLTNYGTPRREALARGRELLELVGLPIDAIDRYPHQFSGGQRQRIAIARALAMEPEVIVADEAVSALDVSVQAQVLTLLNEIQLRLGIAVLFITHDLRVAAQICDDVLVMQRGRLIEYGPAAQVLGQPQAEYTRQLMEAAPGRGWDFTAGAPIKPRVSQVEAH